MTLKSLKKLFRSFYKKNFGPREPFLVRLVDSTKIARPFGEYLRAHGYTNGDEVVLIKKSDYLRLIEVSRRKTDSFWAIVNFYQDQHFLNSININNILDKDS